MTGISIRNDGTKIIRHALTLLNTLLDRLGKPLMAGFAVMMALSFEETFDAVGNRRIRIVCQISCTVKLSEQHQVGEIVTRVQLRSEPWSKYLSSCSVSTHS